MILDKNVVSEIGRPSPSPAVVAFVDANAPAFSVSSITLLEPCCGLAARPAGRRTRERIAQLAATITALAGDDVLGFGSIEAESVPRSRRLAEAWVARWTITFVTP